MTDFVNFANERAQGSINLLGDISGNGLTGVTGGELQTPYGKLEAYGQINGTFGADDISGQKASGIIGNLVGVSQATGYPQEEYTGLFGAKR